MKHGRIKVYYNLRSGYIFCAETTVAGTVMKTVIDPVSIGKPDLSDAQLGENILETIEKSRKAQPVERAVIKDFKFWQISGIKGVAAFSKKFDCVSVFEEGDKLKIEQMVRDTDGAYFVPQDLLPVQLDRDRADISCEIGREVRKMLTRSPAKGSDRVMSFETVYGQKVTYIRPSDGFLDVGDGHTDAYQVFVQESAPNNAILFLIDNQYPQLDEAAIQARWEQVYGDLQEFTYRTSQGRSNELMIDVAARAKSCEVIARIYRGDHGQLEVTAQIDRVGTSAECQDKLRTEFQSLVASVELE